MVIKKRLRAEAQPLGELARAAHLGQPQRDGPAAQHRLREGAAADGVLDGDRLDIYALYPRVFEEGFEFAREALRRGTELLFGLEYHLYRRDVVVSAAQVEAKRRLEGRERHLVDAQRAKQLVLLQFCDEFFFADDAADLRPAEQLVAREGDEVAAGFERLRDGRVVLARKARRREVYQHAAAQVLHED